MTHPALHSESSRSEARSPPFCPWVVHKTRPSDLNIFDNPEAFESLSDTPSPKTPTAEEFFKNLAIKINQNSSFLSENVNESQLQNSSNLDTSGTDLQPNIAGKVVCYVILSSFVLTESCRLLAIWTQLVKNLSVLYT